MKSMTILGAMMLLGASTAVCSAPNYPVAVQKHLDKAKLTAGEDLKDTIGLLCTQIDPKEPDLATARSQTLKTPPPSRAFDNLYYLGIGSVGSWALTTSDGIILFDTLNTPAEAEQYIVGGLKTLGLKPEDIRHIVVMHGHGDHYGGARYLQEKYPRLKLLMSEDDYALAEQTNARPGGRFSNLPPPRRDIVVKHGDKLTLGNTTLTLYVYPGHTPGSISTLIPVTDKGKPHLMSFWGGTTPPRQGGEALGQFSDSFHKWTKIVHDSGADGLISNHPQWDDSIAKLQVLRENPRAANPYVLGKGVMDRYAVVQEECVQAAVALRAAK